MAAKLGAEAARQLAGRYPADGPTILAAGGGPVPDAVASTNSAPVVAGAEAVDRGAVDRGRAVAARTPPSGVPAREPVEWPAGLEWLHPMARRGNSNSWVIGGGRSATGRPMLANDPHLLVEFPSHWYEMHLVAAGLDVTGVTIPGIPFVIIGHNRRIAWGFTNSGADVQDLTLERIDVARKRYMSAGGWQPATVTRVDIPVRGRSTPEPFDVWETARGPILADASSLEWQAPPAFMTPDRRQRRAGGAGAGLFAAMGRHHRRHRVRASRCWTAPSDWSGFEAAVDAFDTPSQNIVYADVDGNIGYALSGRLPVRSSGDGTMPSAGGAGSAWMEGGPRPLLPRALNPESGLHRFVEQRDRSRRRRDDHPGLGGALPRRAPGRGARAGTGPVARRDGHAAGRHHQPGRGARAGGCEAGA